MNAPEDNHDFPFLDVCVLSEPRANEMDFEMAQATRDMPHVRVFGAHVTVAQAVQIGIDTLDEAIEGIGAYRRNVYGDDRVRFVVLPGVGDDDATPIAWTKRFDAPIYGIRADGSLVAADGFHENITISDLARSAGEFGNGTNDRLVLVAPTGLGDASVYHEVVAFLLDHWLEYALATWSGFKTVRRAVLRRSAIRAARRAAEAMLHAGLAQPWQLRRFTDTRSEWKLPRFARLMQISHTDAARLLRALGYEPRGGGGGVWEPSESRRASRARGRWIRDESRRTES